MKKVLFLIVSLACAVTGAWAEESGSTTIQLIQENGQDKGILFTVDKDPNLASIDWVINYGTYTGTVGGVGTHHIAQVGGVVKFKGKSSADVVNASSIESLVNEKKDGNQQWYNYRSNGVIDVSEITLSGAISTLPAQQSGGYAITGLIYTNNTALPEWVNSSKFVYALSNGTSESYLYTTEDQTTLPSGLTIVTSGSVNYVLTGSGAETMAEQLKSAGVPEANIEYTAAPKPSITYDSTNKIVSVHVPEAGQFKKLFDQNGSSVADGTRFVFDSESYVNKEDLLCILQGNKYYVDLFNIGKGEDAPMHVDDYTTPSDDADANNIDKIIEAAVADMVSNSYQARGIILPLNTGSGTGQVEMKNNGKQPTFSEYASYYRRTQSLVAIHAYDMNEYHYHTSDLKGDDNCATTHYATAYDHLMSHQEPAASEIFMVSTNNMHKFDLSTKLEPDTKTEIFVSGDEMVKESTWLADIYVKTNASDEFSVAATTGLHNTPTDRLVVEGPVSKADIEAINFFNNPDVDGPKMYNLGGTTGDYSSLDDEGNEVSWLSGIANSKVQYIVVPEAASDAIEPSTFSSDLNDLHCVISTSSTSTNLVAYVKVPGSLGMARRMVTGKADGYESPKTINLTNVRLSGSLNAADICVNGKVDNQGHITSGTGVDIPKGLYQVETIETLDLTDAVFLNNEDMNFKNLGLVAKQTLKTVKLPTSPLVHTIPANCFQEMNSLEGGYICIPYNIKHIGNNAFSESNVSHVTTTDKIDGTEIDNGPDTYTFSANLESIGTNCFWPIEGSNINITDVYVLATKVPTCPKDAFRTNFTYGYGSFGGPGVYSREHYNGTSKSSVAILHFPDEKSFNAAPAGKKETDGYTKMREKYTDITKVYSKKDQTGAVDANGNPLLWPIRTEMNRVYNQASANQEGWTVGVIWNDWSDAGDPWNGINEGPASGDTPPASCSFAGYEGWHQFVLTIATYVAPADDIDEETEKPVRNYVDDHWYTFCIPFDMTESEVIELLGVPATKVDEAGKVTSDVIYQYGEEMNTVAKMPEIRTLEKVTRRLDGSKGTIQIFLSDNLAEKKEGKYTYYNPKTNKYEENTATDQDNRGEDIVIRGGYPYLIKPYVWDKLTIDNLGKSVMDRYEFPSSASSVYREKCFIELGGTHGDDKAYKSPFAVPYEGHEVQAVFTDVKTQQTAPAIYKDGGKKMDYNYRFMGQYWQQPLPLNSYYVSSLGNWNYYQRERSGYYWKPYNCVINVSSVLDEAKTTYFEEVGMDASGGAVFTGNLHLEYAAGHNDSFVANENQEARSIRIVFDEAIEELDDEGNVMTAIESLDGQDVTPLTGKIYNVKGQYVGNSAEGLTKGIYIVNGKKIVVD